MAETKTYREFVDAYGRPAGQYPVVDLDTADQQRHVLIVSYAGGTKKALVQFMGLAAGERNEHLCLDVHAFVDDREARSGVFGMENGARYTGFDETAPGRSHCWPAVRLVAVLIGAQTDTTPQGDTAANSDTTAQD
jgi:hypothetical protein